MKHMIQTALTMLRAGEWMPMTAARVLIGIFFCISGGAKLFVANKFSEMQQTMIQSQIPFPHGSAPFVSLVEFAGGAGRARTAHSPLRRSAHGGHDRRNLHEPDRSIHASGYLAWLDDFLYLPEVLYVLILFWLLFSGPGRYSVE